MKNTLIAITLFLLVVPFAAFAHERQLFSVGGLDYLFIVGSLDEPIVVDDKTGLDLRVLAADPRNPTNAKASGARPVTGLETTLKVELIAGEKKKILDLTPAYNDPGAYRAMFFPTVETTYTYRLFGKLNETPIDLSFTCNPAGHVAAPEDKTEMKLSDGVVRKFKAGQFGCPVAKKEMTFPEPAMSLVELHQDAEHHMTVALAAGKSKAQGALILAGLALVLASIALLRSRRRTDVHKE